MADVHFPATREELSALQLTALKAAWSEVLASNPFWQQRAAVAGLSKTLSGWDDFHRLPTLQKSDLVADQALHPPYGSNLTQPLAAYTRLHQTSGTTTGQPLRWLDTPRTWLAMQQIWWQLYQLMPLAADDRGCFPFSFGPFLGFWAGFEAALAQGNFCIAAGGLSSEARLKLIRDNRITLVGCTPTYALRLVEVAAQLGLDLRERGVRKILVAGEPGGQMPGVRSRIEEAWGARVVDHWGMTEVGPLAMEAAVTPGSLTVLETDCIAEILHTDRDEPVATGEIGELVITTLRRLDAPVFRYRTGDLVQGDISPTASGTCFLRLIGGVLGRTDDMLIIRGNNVFPSSIEAIIREFDGVAEFRLLVTRNRAMTHLRVQIEPAPDVPASQTLALTERIGQGIKDRLHFQADVQPVPAGTLPRFEMKARRIEFVDAPPS